MSPNRNQSYKVVKPIPPHKIAKPTPRTHEENQERAYIAASRRSDRSLEARMESAKRASEIHKKRTGRYYRITEETVINEQMYEEEDDTPRFRLTGNMHMPNTLLQQRAQAIMTLQMESRRLLGQAVNSTLHHNPQFQNQAQFVSPGMMQMSPSAYQFQMPPPQMFSNSVESPTSYHQSSYPSPNDSMKHNGHQRAATIAVPPQQGRHSAQTSPVEAPVNDSRRMSLPPQNAMSHSPQFTRRPSNQATPVVSHSGSHPSTPHSSTSPQAEHFGYGGSMLPPSPAAMAARQNMSNSMGPLTTSLPRETQQLLDSGIWPNMNMGSFDSMMQNQSGMQQQQPFYNYRPNSHGSTNKQQFTSAGLDQTLTPTASDPYGEGMKASATNGTLAPADSGVLSSDIDEQRYGFPLVEPSNLFHFDDNMHAFDAYSSGPNSGHVTPHDEWASFLDNDMFVQ